MINKMFILLIVNQVLAQGPLWVNQFTVNFTELNIDVGIKAHTSGQMIYDFKNNQYRIDRENGIGDRYCGTTYKLRNTPCSHIVKDNRRYLYFPNLAKCCYCCDQSHGCGVLKPDWAQDAEFVEDTTDFYGNEVQKFNKKGLQSNYIYQIKDTPITSQIDQEPNSFLYFLVNTWTPSVDSKVFEFPAKCKDAPTCPLLSICTEVRNS